MSLFRSMVYLQAELFLLMICGYVMKKKHVINAEQQKGLSALLVSLILPASIISSFTSGVSADAELMHNAAAAAVISALIQTVSCLLGPVLFGKYDRSRSTAMRYGLIVSNSSFIGIPVVEAIYGSIGTMYTSIFQIPIRLTMWTVGLGLYTGGTGNLKERIGKTVTHPCMIAVVIGSVLLLTGWNLPVPVRTALSALGRCTTAVSMLIIGALLSDIHTGNLWEKPILYFSLVRLVLFPLVVLFLLGAVPVDGMIRNIAVIMTAMPAGSMTAILAQQYGFDAEYAARLIFVSTLASIVTIPVLTLLL